MEDIKAAGLRVNALLERYKINAATFEKECGLSRASVYKARNFDALSAEQAKKITDHFPEVSYIWLLTGEGPMIAPSPAAMAAGSEAMVCAIEKLTAAIDRLTNSIEKCPGLNSALHS